MMESLTPCSVNHLLSCNHFLDDHVRDYKYPTNGTCSLQVLTLPPKVLKHAREANRELKIGRRCECEFGCVNGCLSLFVDLWWTGELSRVWPTPWQLGYRFQQTNRCKSKLSHTSSHPCNIDHVIVLPLTLYPFGILFHTFFLKHPISSWWKGINIKGPLGQDEAKDHW